MTAQTTFYGPVLEKLNARDSAIHDYMTEISENYNFLYSRNRRLEDENESLRKDNLIFKQSNSDPQVLQNLRESNSELQRKITNNYEDYKKVQDNLMNKIEELQKVTEKNTQLLQEVGKLKEKASSLDKNLKIKESSLVEVSGELTNVTSDRVQLIQMRDSLQTEVTNLKNENNQVEVACH